MTTSTKARNHHIVTNPAGSNPMLRDLGSEWRRLATAQHALRRVNSWGLPQSPVRHLDEVLSNAGFGLDPRDSVADRYLFLLVERAATDELAARIVLQRLLPSLISVARRRGRITVGGFDEAFTEILSHAWLLIRTYPTGRRPAKVASNLVRDSEYHAFVKPTRYQRYTVQPCDTESMAHVADPHTDEPAALVLHDMLNRAEPTMTPLSVTILRQLADGVTVEELAEMYGVQLRTARTWRRNAISELRARTRSAA